MLSIQIIIGQTAYIEVKGEPNLSVFLNNKFQGKTTVELGGYIIENVTAGKNLIKIVKEGFIPFEESILIKSGEVFAYKVKPFVKNQVTITESGNTGETDKKATFEIGKLIIQSVPINIKITIPTIEGVLNSTKNKDEWIVDNIAEGIRDVTFTYNKKVIKKTFKIIGGETTKLFINMLNGDYKTKNTIDDRNNVSHFIDSILNVYASDPNLKREDFKNKKAQKTNQGSGFLSMGSGGGALFAKKPNAEVPSEIKSDINTNLEKFGYSILISKKNKDEIIASYNKIADEIKKFPNIYGVVGDVESSVTDFDVRVTFTLSRKKLFVLVETLK